MSVSYRNWLNNQSIDALEAHVKRLNIVQTKKGLQPHRIRTELGKRVALKIGGPMGVVIGGIIVAAAPALTIAAVLGLLVASTAAGRTVAEIGRPRIENMVREMLSTWLVDAEDYFDARAV